MWIFLKGLGRMKNTSMSLGFRMDRIRLMARRILEKLRMNRMEKTTILRMGRMRIRS